MNLTELIVIPGIGSILVKFLHNDNKFISKKYDKSLMYLNHTFHKIFTPQFLSLHKFQVYSSEEYVNLPKKFIHLIRSMHLGLFMPIEHILPNVRDLTISSEKPFNLNIKEFTNIHTMTLHCYNHTLNRSMFPPDLTHLDIHPPYSQTLVPGSLPESLTHLTFSCYCGPLVPQVFPFNLTHLAFNNLFNKPLEKNIFPESLLQLNFSNDFNQPLEHDVLPGSLQRLTFGYSFNQPLKHDVLPRTLQQLTFGAKFNHPIVHRVLPGSLQQLTFGDRFNQPLEQDVLPESLKQLTFGRHFNQPLEHNVLPRSLHNSHLVIYSISHQNTTYYSDH